MLVKMTPIAATEMHKLCTDLTESVKFNAAGTVHDFEMTKSLSHVATTTAVATTTEMKPCDLFVYYENK